jgi:hypothetical protein
MVERLERTRPQTFGEAKAIPGLNGRGPLYSVCRGPPRELTMFHVSPGRDRLCGTRETFAEPIKKPLNLRSFIETLRALC